MNSLIRVLSRFRKETTAVIADVEQMFYQVLAPVEDCNYLRYLWWPQGDLTSAPKEFQMLVHVLGGLSLSSCASFAMQRAPEDNQDQFDKEAIKAVRRNFYVDDCLKSVGSEQDAIRLIDQLRHLLAKGELRLTKFQTLLKLLIPESERAGSVKELDLDHLPVEHTLGMEWDVQSDLFGFKITVKDRPLTRRGILSVVSSIYDALGFLSPFIL